MDVWPKPYESENNFGKRVNNLKATLGGKRKTRKMRKTRKTRKM